MLTRRMKTAAPRSIVKALFRKLHTLFTESMSNPFYKPGQPIASKKLDGDLGMHARIKLARVCVCV